MPNSVFSTVDLPAPLGPISSVISPLARVERGLVQDREARRVAGDDLVEFDDLLGSWSRQFPLSCQDRLRAPAGSPAPSAGGPSASTLPSTMQITCGQSFMMKSMLCSMTTKLPPCVLLSSTSSSRSWSTRLGIDAGAGLVEQHEARRRHERHRDVDQLLLAVGQRCRPAGARRACRRNSSIISSAWSPRPASGAANRRPGERALELLRGDDQVVAHRQLAEHLQRLERAADAAPRELERRHAGDVLAAELDAARRSA